MIKYLDIERGIDEENYEESNHLLNETEVSFLIINDKHFKNSEFKNGGVFYYFLKCQAAFYFLYFISISLDIK